MRKLLGTIRWVDNLTRSGVIRHQDKNYFFSIGLYDKNYMELERGQNIIFNVYEDSHFIRAENIEIIEEELEVCCYCESDRRNISCCGENHFKRIYVTNLYNTYDKEDL